MKHMTNTIAFPGLGLSFEINRVAFTVFGKEIYWYALILLSGFLLGLLFVYNTCEKRGISKDHVFDISFWGLIIGIICARIYYVIFDWESLEGNIWNIFKIWNGGIAIYGSLIGAVGTAYVYSKIKKIKPLKVFDVFVPGLLIGQFVGRWGNFVNAEVYGGITTLPWRMTINGGPGVHPLFIYESLWNFLGFILVCLFRDRKKTGILFLHPLVRRRTSVFGGHAPAAVYPVADSERLRNISACGAYCNTCFGRHADSAFVQKRAADVDFV